MPLGTAPRRRSALGVISMALALAAAAFVGSSMGYVWSFLTNSDDDQTHKANVAAPGS